MAEKTANPTPSTPPVDEPTPTPATPPVTTPAPSETPPVAPPPPTPPVAPVTPTLAPSMSEEQITTLKGDITKDVSTTVGEEVSKSVIQKIGDALGLTKKEEAALPTDASSLKKLVDNEVTKRFDKESQDAEKEEKQEVGDRQVRISSTIKGWHFQYNELSRLGKVPLIKNATDENDEGVVARRKLIVGIGRIIEYIQKTDPNSNYIPSVSEVLVREPSVLKEVPGADLPISGNTAVREGQDSFAYEKDIKGKTFQDIVDQGT